MLDLSQIEDAGFDFSALSEFRTRLIEGNAQQRLLNTLHETERSLRAPLFDTPALHGFRLASLLHLRAAAPRS